MAGFDDDGDGTKDNLFVAGPGELGMTPTDVDNAPLGNFPGVEDIDLNGNGVFDVGDDLLLTDPAAPGQGWPLAFGALPPLCWPTGIAIEDPAYEVEPDNENGRAALDWGSPGKQHRTISATD